ncbi:MAG: M48 family metallopeptidase [Tannerella sp.]|jgi:predicted metal-dependent hydrolase|nr:M48 family metallopeptidase [Tannerella sp.]
MKEKIINDLELGEIVLRRNRRAKRYLIHIKDGKIIATIPWRGNEQTMLAFIHEQRSRLVAMQQKNAKHRLLDERTELQTLTFRLHIFRSQRTNFYAALKEGMLHIACPENTDFGDRQIQQKLHSILKQALKREANLTLPVRLKHLARLHHFDYNKVNIRDTKTRWGSCTARKDISLSVSLMLLPLYLADYVMLHELCHTVEMNHSERFWSLMDKVTNKQAKILRRELKEHQML